MSQLGGVGTHFHPRFHGDQVVADAPDAGVHLLAGHQQRPDQQELHPHHRTHHHPRTNPWRNRTARSSRSR